MGFRTFVYSVVVLAVLAWVGFTAAGAGWSYLATQEMVDRVLQEASDRHRAALAAGTSQALEGLAADVRTGILRAARRDGLIVDPSSLRVSPMPGGVEITLRWSYPALSYGGRDLLVIPLSLHKSAVRGL
jgi:hypothetical protein